MYLARITWKKPIPDRLITITDHQARQIARAPMRKGEDATTALTRLGLRDFGPWEEDREGGQVRVEPRWDETLAGQPDVGIAVDPFRRRVTVFVNGAVASVTSRDAQLVIEAIGQAAANLEKLDEADADVRISDDVVGDPEDVATIVRTHLSRANRTVGDLAEHLDEPVQGVRQRLAGAVPFTDEEIAATAEFLGVDVNELAVVEPIVHTKKPPPLFPMPIREYSDEPAGDDEVRHYGYCAWFCAAEAPAQGASVADHGNPWCESLPVATMDGIGVDGVDVELYAALAEGYLHGFYRRESRTRRIRRNRQFIHLLLVDRYRHRAEWVADSGQARKFAAGLTHAADVMEGLAINPRLGR